MTKRRVHNLMKRAGVEDVPLSRCRTIEEFNAALEKLSDAQLLDAWSRTLGIAASRLSDDELLRELDDARREEDRDNNPTSAVG